MQFMRIQRRNARHQHPDNKFAFRIVGYLTTDIARVAPGAGLRSLSFLRQYLLVSE